MRPAAFLLLLALIFGVDLQKGGAPCQPCVVLAQPPAYVTYLPGLKQGFLL